MLTTKDNKKVMVDVPIVRQLADRGYVVRVDEHFSRLRVKHTDNEARDWLVDFGGLPEFLNNLHHYESAC